MIEWDDISIGQRKQQMCEDITIGIHYNAATKRNEGEYEPRTVLDNVISINLEEHRTYHHQVHLTVTDHQVAVSSEEDGHIS